MPSGGPAAHWPEQRVALEPGDTLLFYTDGVTDTPGRGGRFGQTRLNALLARASYEPKKLLEALDRELAGFRVGETSDDIAMLAAQFAPDHAPPKLEPSAAQAAVGSLAFD